MTKYSLATLAGAFFLVACAGSSSGPGSTVPAPVSSPSSLEPSLPSANIRNSPATWKISPTTELQTYSSVLTSRIRQLGTLENRQDSLIIKTLYSISVTRNPDAISLSGLIAGFTVESSGQTGAYAPLMLEGPIVFTGKTTNHKTHLEATNTTSTISSTPCDNISQTPLNTVQRNNFLIPLEISVGQTWEDSLSSVVCKGSLPLNVTSVRSYRVMGITKLKGLDVLVIDQNERTLSKGEGSQDQHRVFVEAQGVTIRHLSVDLVSGILLDVRAESKTTLSVQTSGRIQHFSEISTEITTKTR